MRVETRSATSAEPGDSQVAPPDGVRVAADGAAAPTEPEPDLAWSFNPWRERPAAAAVALAVTLALVVLLAGLGLPPLACAVLGAGVAFTLGPLLFPVRCRVDGAGLACRGTFGWERRRWEDVRRAVAVRGGLLLSPFPEPQPLDRFRALLLPMPASERVMLRERLASRLAAHGLAFAAAPAATDAAHPAR